MTATSPPRGERLLRSFETLGLRALMRRTGLERRRIWTPHGEMHLLTGPGEGTGPPLVLVHGLGSASIDLTPLILGLRGTTRQLIVPDLPGHGWSSVDAVPVLHEAVERMLEPVVSEPVVVVGNSLGGFVGLRWALSRPEDVRGLVLLSPGGAPGVGSDLDALLGSFALRDQADALRFIDRIMAERGPLAARWLRAWAVRRRLWRPGPRTLLDNATPDRLLTPSEVAAAPGRLLLVWGEQDDVLPREHLDFWKAHLPDHAEIEEPPGYGHSPYLDDPRTLVRRIERFVDGLP